MLTSWQKRVHLCMCVHQKFFVRLKTLRLNFFKLKQEWKFTSWISRCMHTSNYKSMELVATGKRQESSWERNKNKVKLSKRSHRHYYWNRVTVTAATYSKSRHHGWLYIWAKKRGHLGEKKQPMKLTSQNVHIDTYCCHEWCCQVDQLGVNSV